MTEEQKPADPAGSEEVIDQVEGQDEGQTAEEGKPTEEEKEAERKRESAKERREREKAYKARLKEERDEAERAAKAAEARASRILEAGKVIEAPKESDFTDYTEFVAAKAVWDYGRKAAERDAGQITEEAKAAKARADAIRAEEDRVRKMAWAEQVAQAKSRYADFEQVAYTAPIADHIAEIVMQSEDAADVAYYLGQNRELSLSLSRMSPLEAAREIGRIEAKLSLPPPKTKTSAPDPISPVRGPAAAGKDPSAMNQAEYNAWRKAGGTFG